MELRVFRGTVSDQDSEMPREIRILAAIENKSGRKNPRYHAKCVESSGELKLIVPTV